MADQFAEALNHVSSAKADEDPEDCAEVALGAGAMGVPLIFCAYSEQWVAGNEGYLIYHQFYPGGPRAEDAWWFGKLGNKSQNCADYEGTKDEGEYYAPLYRDFLRHFPSGKHASEAKELLKGFEDQARMK